MSEPRSKPSLIVITGRPGSGKSTLAVLLAREIRCPLISRDQIKEGRVNSLDESGALSADITKQVYETFFETIELLLRREVTLIAEAAFQHKLWAPRLEPMKALANLRIIVCDIDSELARRRWIERSQSDPDWRRFHPDPISEDYEPPQMDVPTLRLDTFNGYQPNVSQVRDFVAKGTI